MTLDDQLATAHLLDAGQLGSANAGGRVTA